MTSIESRSGTVPPSGHRSQTRTQTDQVLDYLRNTGPLDQFTAKDELGVLRLGARIWDLKQRGYAIRTELVEAPTEYGGSRIAQYSLLREAVREAAAPPASPAPHEDERAIEAVQRSQPSEPRTLDEALWTFGDRAASLGVSPTVREYQQALGAASESVAHRWLRVLEREGYLTLNELLGAAGGGTGARRVAARSWHVTPPGYERLYFLERARRVAAEESAMRRERRAS